MDENKLQTLTYRTKPDIYAQLGLCHFCVGNFDTAVQHSNYCEAYKLESTASGELLRTLLRGLINDQRDQRYLADISFNYMPSLLEDYTDVDIHIEALFYKYSVDRIKNDQDQWKKDNLKRKAVTFCKAHKLSNTLEWFK
jgi:hypothetical protein